MASLSASSTPLCQFQTLAIAHLPASLLKVFPCLIQIKLMDHIILTLKLLISNGCFILRIETSTLFTSQFCVCKVKRCGYLRRVRCLGMHYIVDVWSDRFVVAPYRSRIRYRCNRRILALSSQMIFTCFNAFYRKSRILQVFSVAEVLASEWVTTT